MAKLLLCHAAGQPTYEVREIRELEGERGVDLGVRYTSADYLEAVDFALDYLERNDPLQRGDVSALEIVKVQGDEREPMMAYSHRLASGVDKDLIGLWGFDVTRPWHGPEYASTATR